MPRPPSRRRNRRRRMPTKAVSDSSSNAEAKQQAAADAKSEADAKKEAADGAQDKLSQGRSGLLRRQGVPLRQSKVLHRSDRHRVS